MTFSPEDDITCSELRSSWTACTVSPGCLSSFCFETSTFKSASVTWATFSCFSPVWTRQTLFFDGSLVWSLSLCWNDKKRLNEPTHEIMAVIAFRKLNLQTRMHSNPLGLHVWFLVRPFIYFHTLCVRTAIAQMCSLTWAFAVRLCDKYHNLMSWLKCFWTRSMIDISYWKKNHKK